MSPERTLLFSDEAWELSGDSSRLVVTICSWFSLLPSVPDSAKAKSTQAAAVASTSVSCPPTGHLSGVFECKEPYQFWKINGLNELRELSGDSSR